MANTPPKFEPYCFPSPANLSSQDGSKLFDQPEFRPFTQHFPQQLHPTPNESISEVSLVTALQRLLDLHMGLPRKEMPKFSGNPLDYWKFYRGFHDGVARYITDPANRLSYLISCCEGEAREAIDYCTILDPEEGYTEAWNILRRRYGNPSVISRQFLASITDGPPLKPNDNKGLMKLAEAMKACELTLKQLNYSSELNTLSTIGAVVSRLPNALQNRWYDTAASILQDNREPSFADLAKFVQDRSEAATVKEMYRPHCSAGRSERNEPAVTRSSGLHNFSTQLHEGNRRVTVNSNSSRFGGWKFVCPKCNGPHYLDQCARFLNLDVSTRLAFVTEAALCKLCLKPRHNAGECQSRRLCGIDNCASRHHRLLHTLPETKDEALDTKSPRTKPLHSYACGSRGEVAMAVVTARICGPNGTRVIYALLDSGSDSTFIEESLVKELGFTTFPTNMTMSTLSGASVLQAGEVVIDVQSLVSQGVTFRTKALTVKRLPAVIPKDPAVYYGWKHLRDIDFPYHGPHPIALLVGVNLPAAHHVLESRIGASHEPFAILTPFGWTVLGPLHHDRYGKLYCNTMLKNAVENEERIGCDDHSNPNDLLSKIESMYSMEFNEATSTKVGTSYEDELAIDLASRSIQMVNGHYQLPLPWKEGCPELPTNYFVALHRLASIERKLKNDEQLKGMYRAALTDYIERGYAERVESPIAEIRGRVWYLPHHPVTHPLKPGKVRVVFDCACRVQNKSLNSQLMTGPDISNSLFGVLLRFRQYPHVFSADIESMFHQVRVPVNDRDYLRFLWRDDLNSERNPDIFRMTVHPFGATSSPFCATFALRQALQDNRSLFVNADSSLAERAFYVDDCLHSAASESELVEFALSLKMALAAGGFNLTKWSTNTDSLLRLIPEDERVKRPISIDLQSDTRHRTLGVWWNSTVDEFEFDVKQGPGILNKRSILSYIASIYDPLGFIGPLILHGRKLFQDLCRSDVSWDAPLTDEANARWTQWMDMLQGIKSLKIPRCLTKDSASDSTYEIHSFSDASQSAYGAVLYLRYRDLSGRLRCSFICGKSRVAPLKAVTIPRLELAAALLSARLTAKVREEITLPVDHVTHWTDSMIVLQSIRNKTSRFQTYVANRVSAIREISSINDWRFVDSVNNPADAASRGLNVGTLQGGSWLNGPEFLKNTTDAWPQEPDHPRDNSDDMETAETNCLVSSQSGHHWFNRFERFNSWISLLRAIAWIKRFCEFVKCGRNSYVPPARYLTARELKKASVDVIVLTQSLSFVSDLNILRRSEGSGYLLRSSQLRKLKPFLHEGIIRVGGRLQWALEPFETRHPAILPRKHFVTRLIIQHYHKINGHMGSSQVLASIRQRFWIVKGHAAVKSVLAACQHCRRWYSKPCQQIMGSLPMDRVRACDKPFDYVGVDYFGPILVKRGRGTERRYGCVFTCLIVRAIHIELANSLTTDSFLCAFSRFVARRGSPKRLRSDNATNFKAAEIDVKKCLQLWDQERITKRLAEIGCEWEFSTPSASHEGGVWERMIRSVRRILRSILGETLVDEETLYTALVEVEKILNDRPLVKLTSDPRDYTALTPNQLLLLHRNPATQELPSGPMTLTKRWRKAHALAEQFWSRWRKEYLNSLQTAQTWLRRGRDLHAGDLVLMSSPLLPRGQWAKGLVEKTIRSSDGVVRKAIIRTSNGIYSRDVRQLHLLEAAEETLSEEVKGQQEEHTKPEEVNLEGEC